MIFARTEYLKRLELTREDGLVKVVTGIRRAGKSFLLNELFYDALRESGVPEDHIIRFAFDSLDDRALIGAELAADKKADGLKFLGWINEKLTGSGIYYILLDEVQELENFEAVLNSLLRKRNVDIYVTGSNSRFLSGDILTEFRGRGEEIHVFPLSFREYTAGMGLRPEEAWRDYVEIGGIPVVAGMRSREQQYSYLRNLCDEVYLADIVARNHVQNDAELSELLDVTASMMASVTNPTRITNTFNAEKKRHLCDDTVYRYLKYFEDAFLLSRVKRFDVEGRRYINASYKFYFEDIGIRNARLNFRQINETHIMENIIYNELRMRGFQVDVGAVEIREKTDRRDKNGKYIYDRKQLEVDFVASRGAQKYYIQSAYAMPTAEKEEQEKKSLIHIQDSFQKIVLVKDDIHIRRDEDGVITMGVYDFLLHPDRLQL